MTSHQHCSDGWIIDWFGCGGGDVVLDHAAEFLSRCAGIEARCQTTAEMCISYEERVEWIGGLVVVLDVVDGDLRA